MHTFYLGMVQNEGKLCLKSLLDDKLAEFSRHLKGIRMSYDLAWQIANRHKKFRWTYRLNSPTVEKFCMCLCRAMFCWFVINKLFKSLRLLCEIVVCICKPTLNEVDVVNMYRMVQDHHKAFTAAYGK